MNGHALWRAALLASIAGAGRLRDLILLDFREAERVAALVVDLGFI